MDRKPAPAWWPGGLQVSPAVGGGVDVADLQVVGGERFFQGKRAGEAFVLEAGGDALQLIEAVDQVGMVHRAELPLAHFDDDLDHEGEGTWDADGDRELVVVDACVIEIGAFFDHEPAAVGLDGEHEMGLHLEGERRTVLGAGGDVGEDTAWRGSFEDGEVLFGLGEDASLFDADGDWDGDARDADGADLHCEAVFAVEVLLEALAGLQAEVAVAGIDGEEVVFGVEFQLSASADEGAHGADDLFWKQVLMHDEQGCWVGQVDGLWDVVDVDAQRGLHGGGIGGAGRDG